MKSGKAPSILIVDDVPDNILLIRKCLKGEGYELRTAADGEQALAEIERDPPHLVLLDVMMPGIDGIEVCRRIKSSGDSRFMPVLLMTAHHQAGVKRRGLEAGAEDFIPKPFEPEELIARIRSHLRTKRLYDDLSDSYEYIERDVEAIGALQRSLLPAAPPQARGAAFHCFYQPSRMAGGDFYDFLEPSPGKIGIAIADVSGHGPQASVLMAMMKMSLRMHEKLWGEPGKLLSEINSHLLKFVPLGDFITMFYGIFEPATGALRYASAGHCPPVIFDGQGRDPRMLRVVEGFPLCLQEGGEFEEEKIKLAPNERMLFYTDGIVEVQSDDGRILGIDPFVETVGECGKTSGAAMIESLLAAARKFSSDRPFRDDCTLILLERS